MPVCVGKGLNALPTLLNKRAALGLTASAPPGPLLLCHRAAIYHIMGLFGGRPVTRPCYLCGFLTWLRFTAPGRWGRYCWRCYRHFGRAKPDGVVIP